MGDTLIITGASRGIGAATAHLAATRGWAVCVNYHQAQDAAEAVVAAIAAGGGRAVAVQADIAVEAEVERLFETAEAELGPLGGLVNNAGTTGGFRRVDECDGAFLADLFDVNVVAYFVCAREAVRRLSTRYGGSGGAIVNVSSLAAVTGSPNEYVHYAAAKGAIDTMTIGLAREVAGDGIRVNAVNPALIETEIHAAGGRPDRVRELASKVPMGRGGTAEEVAQAVMWLLSDGASFTTGARLPLSGGL